MPEELTIDSFNKVMMNCVLEKNEMLHLESKAQYISNKYERRLSTLSNK